MQDQRGTMLSMILVSALKSSVLLTRSIIVHAMKRDFDGEHNMDNLDKVSTSTPLLTISATKPMAWCEAVPHRHCVRLSMLVHSQLLGAGRCKHSSFCMDRIQ